MFRALAASLSLAAAASATPAWTKLANSGLPPSAYHNGAVVGSTIYVVGGQYKTMKSFSTEGKEVSFTALFDHS